MSILKFSNNLQYEGQQKTSATMTSFVSFLVLVKASRLQRKKRPAHHLTTGLLKGYGFPPAPSFEPATKATCALAVLKAARLPSTGNDMIPRRLQLWLSLEVLSTAGASGNAAFQASLGNSSRVFAGEQKRITSLYGTLASLGTMTWTIA